MFIQIDPSAGSPLQIQVQDQIRRLIDEGALPPGTPLPPTRKLADTLGISRCTVVRAYEELQARGYLRSRPGSYNIVQPRRREAGPAPVRAGAIPWAERCDAGTEAALRSARRISLSQASTDRPAGPEVDLGALAPDGRLFPLADFQRAVGQVLYSQGAAALGYGTDARGYLPLREHLAQRMRLHGVTATADEILVTHGAQQAFDLVLRLLGPHPAVAVESPTYAHALPLLALHGARIVPVDMTPDGMDLDRLARALSRRRIDLVYTMPNFQNPTGVTTGHGHRERLLELCTRHRVPLLEDAFEEDLKYYGKVDLPIKSMDERNVVLYVGTFSKALFPGLRLGWVCADRECIDRLAALKRFTDLGTGNLIQMGVYQFCRLGYYDKHLKRLARAFRRRMDTALRAMARCFPPEVTWIRPLGGYTVWVRLPRPLDDAALAAALAPHGLAVAPGAGSSPAAARRRTSASPSRR